MHGHDDDFIGLDAAASPFAGTDRSGVALVLETDNLGGPCLRLPLIGTAGDARGRL